jgi:hypothetical protein
LGCYFFALDKTGLKADILWNYGSAQLSFLNYTAVVPVTIFLRSKNQELKNEAAIFYTFPVTGTTLGFFLLLFTNFLLHLEGEQGLLKKELLMVEGKRYI